MLSKTSNKNVIRINVTALAKEIGLTRTWVSLVLNGHEKSSGARKLIAKALGMKVEELWPGDGHKKAA